MPTAAGTLLRARAMLLLSGKNKQGVKAEIKTISPKETASGATVLKERK